MMRKIISLAVAVLTGIATIQAAPAIAFASTTHDFGNISEDDGPVVCQFEFTNTGDEPLVIVSANSSCGCTRPVIPRKPVMPGEKGVITVSYHPEGRPGEFSKSIRVRTNAGKSKRIVLKITGVAIPQTPSAQ